MSTDKIIQVLIPRPFDRPFDYQGCAEIGSFVTVPFGKKELKGVVWSKNSGKVAVEKLKNIGDISDIPPMQPALRDFIIWTANYTLAPLGSVLAMAMSVPAALAKTKPTSDHCFPQKPQISKSDITLSKDQAAAAAILNKKIHNGYSVTVLDGVTGSGKTEVYSEAIRSVIEEGKQVLVLLPEIVLTTQLIERFKERFGFAPTQWHSTLTPARRRDNWQAIAHGSASLIIGARSALFLPYHNLGLIVVDEEHESAFKQEDGVIYHGRDMAVARAKIENIPIILVSASPSLETVANVEAGKFELLHMPNRHGGAFMPDIIAVDMRHEKLDSQHWLSSVLKEALIDGIEHEEQSMLYLNRRGYAPLTLCRKCGYRFQCPDCSAWLVEHRYPAYLQCHHCGFTRTLPPQCPSCEESGQFASCGPGVERLEEEVREFLPDARIAMITSDNINSPQKAGIVIKEIEEGRIDIIIGTQMVAKGHHFPKLTLVGVVDADLGLEGGDLRAAERSYQLLHQVSGRAGREDLRGRVIIQSYMPENVVMQALISGDRDDFVHNELLRRKEAHMPPFSRMAAIIISGKDEVMVRKTAADFAICAPQSEGMRVLGPAPAPMTLLRGNYRYRLLAITDRNVNIQKMLKAWLSRTKAPSSVKVKVDIDPYSFI